MQAQIVIVTPALAAANNGNWQTARRWQRFLSPHYPVRLVRDWPDAQAGRDRVMIALHARRSATTIAAWHAERGRQGLAVVLTGTDLYGDIRANPDAAHSLHRAHELVVLQALGVNALPAEVRARTRVILQSTTARKYLPKTGTRLRAVMVGHLREEKSPATLFATAHLLASHTDIHLDHIGAALDPTLADAAQSTMADCANYRWLGGLPHEATRRHIQRAHLLLHPSRIEGGAHVIMEAIASGTPVLASAIDGNIGMLGADYGGYFPWNDARRLADLLLVCRASQHRPDGLLAQLMQQCTSRAQLFRPEAESQAVQQLVADLIHGEHHD